MTLVLVHGNPETDAVWGSLVDVLGRTDVVRLSPPGFGSPLPSGFPATFLAYRDWLVAELESIGEPVDLVGHDWGGCHVVNAVMHRPDLVRSWASDVVGLFDRDYVWHDMAQAFQTPETGEQLVEMMQDGSRTGPGATAGGLRHSQQMSRLRLRQRRVRRWDRRSWRYTARHANRRWPMPDGHSRTPRPGRDLSLSATDDPFVGTDEMRRRAADRAGARTEVLDGLGHWWMVQDPALGAAALTRFWESLDS